jgi:hypothetical protein
VRETSNYFRRLPKGNSVKQIYSFDRLQELDFPSPYGLGLFDKMIKDNPTYNGTLY